MGTDHGGAGRHREPDVAIDHRLAQVRRHFDRVGGHQPTAQTLVQVRRRKGGLTGNRARARRWRHLATALRRRPKTDGDERRKHDARPSHARISSRIPSVSTSAPPSACATGAQKPPCAQQPISRATASAPRLVRRRAYAGISHDAYVAVRQPRGLTGRCPPGQIWGELVGGRCSLRRRSTRALRGGANGESDRARDASFPREGGAPASAPTGASRHESGPDPGRSRAWPSASRAQASRATEGPVHGGRDPFDASRAPPAGCPRARRRTRPRSRPPSAPARANATASPTKSSRRRSCTCARTSATVML